MCIMGNGAWMNNFMRLDLSIVKLFELLSIPKCVYYNRFYSILYVCMFPRNY